MISAATFTLVDGLKRVKQERDQLRAAIKKVSDYNGRLEVTNDQLRARVDELEGDLKHFLTHPAAGECPDLVEMFDNTLNRQPAQSLAAHDARVLRERATEWRGWIKHKEYADLLESDADRIERWADRIEKGEI